LEPGYALGPRSRTASAGRSHSASDTSTHHEKDAITQSRSQRSPARSAVARALDGDEPPGPHWRADPERFDDLSTDWGDQQPWSDSTILITSAYRDDLHVLVEAPDGTMAASTIMWLDPANRSVEFEPVGTHPEYRRLGLARAMMLHGMRLARAAGAVHATVVCMGAPGHPAARTLYYGLGFRELSRDAPLIRAAD
jgi:ribosomal protein S18 acetylase RimI-like enzyme